jgi:hypothetical protein
MLVSGLADLALAAIIIMGWPGSITWVLGLLVGINLLTSGWAILMVAVRTENSNSDITVMQSAKDRVGMDTSRSLNWAGERRVLI